MTTTCINTRTHERLSFDENSKPSLMQQLTRDAAFQRRVKIVCCVAMALLVIGGGVGVGLAFAGIVPYSTLHTVLVGGGTGAVTFGLAGLAFLNADPETDSLNCYFTSLPACHRLKRLLNSAQLSIRDQREWEYLAKYHTEARKKLETQRRTILAELLHNNDVNPISNHVLSFL